MTRSFMALRCRRRGSVGWGGSGVGRGDIWERALERSGATTGDRVNGVWWPRRRLVVGLSSTELGGSIGGVGDATNGPSTSVAVSMFFVYSNGFVGGDRAERRSGLGRDLSVGRTLCAFVFVPRRCCGDDRFVAGNSLKRSGKFVSLSCSSKSKSTSVMMSLFRCMRTRKGSSRTRTAF
jgi:hypothetical protein